MLIGHQKGRDMKENLRRNFGMAHPEGYRKALRLMQLAEKFGHPIVTFIDTPGAYPGLGAEERGQAEAIARNLREMSRLLSRLEDPAMRAVNAVIGYRIKRRDPPHRIFIAKSYNAIVSALFGLRVRDIDCAMKLFRREVFDGLPLDTDSPFLSAELLIKLRARGERLAQVGVNHFPRAAGTNTGASFRKILRTFRDIGKLRLALWTRRREVLGQARP